ncbi:cytochrome P450 [Aspergillus falconensis]
MLSLVSVICLNNPGLAAIVSLLLLALCLLYSCSYPQKTLAWVNGRRATELWYFAAQKRFASDAKGIIALGLRKWPAFNIVTDNGFQTILGPEYANEIRSHPDLDLSRAVQADYNSHISGFEPFKPDTAVIVYDAVRLKLTQRLESITRPLSDETAVALRSNWTDNSNWHSVHAKGTMLQIVAQISSKIFLGDRVCRDPEWLRITIDYTIDAFIASHYLRLWPRLFRPLAARVMTPCRKVRADYQAAKRIIMPLVKERRADREAAYRRGKPPKQYLDALEWMEECAKGRSYDPAAAQLGLSLAAIHTTTDLLIQVLYDLCGQEQVVSALREEIITVILQEGWQKSALYKLKLMDSVLKETQRLKPMGVTSMRRMATNDITLSDGTFLPKGTSLSVSCENHWNPQIYSDPGTYNPYRFLQLREEPGKETAAQLVSPSPDHMGFGFGKQACPGRFFAANEAKIALCHILLKYDFRLKEGYTPRNMVYSIALSADPYAELEVRRRKEEIVL